MKRLSSFSAVVPKLLATLGCEEKVNNVRVLLAWHEVAGPVTSQHATALRLQGDTLLVRTDSPVWSHTLSLMQSEFIEKLRLKVPQKRIRQIRFLCGSDDSARRPYRKTARRRRHS